MRIEHFFSVASVEPFDERVLVRATGLDIVDGDIVLAAPVGEDLGSHLRTVVDPDRFRHPAL